MVFAVTVGARAAPIVFRPSMAVDGQIRRCCNLRGCTIAPVSVDRMVAVNLGGDLNDQTNFSGILYPAKQQPGWPNCVLTLK